MASPAVAATNESAVTTAATSHTVNLPTGISAGHLLLIFMGYPGGAGATDWSGAGFTEIGTVGAANNVIAVGYKQATGSEGSTVSIGSSGSVRSAHCSYRITGHEDPAIRAPEGQFSNEVGSLTPNPGSITPSGGSKDYLFIACIVQAGEEIDDDTWCNSGPSGYTFNSTTAGFQKTCGTAGSAASNCSIATAYVQKTASSEDPGTFSVDQAQAYCWATIAVHPVAIPVPPPLLVMAPRLPSR